ncbi:MAG TPA: metallophosphoesterase [Methanoregula sp.]|nr:metallophosphoesterase [Methanoregula sp.]
MNLEFVGDGPALVVEDKLRFLIAADLHFGIEADLAQHGLHFRSRSKDRLERLLAIIDRTDPDGLVLLGDVKHSIPTLTRQEYYELPRILATLRDRVPLLVFPGNHDTGIERYLVPGEIFAREGAVIDGVGYLHGHMYPSPSLAGHLMIAGHHHPLLTLRDRVGCALQSPAYLRAGVNNVALRMAEQGEADAPTRVLFMPAFNEIAGYDLFQIIRNPTSPLSRHINSDDTEIILADGTYIGPLKTLIPDESD